MGTPGILLRLVEKALAMEKSIQEMPKDQNDTGDEYKRMFTLLGSTTEVAMFNCGKLEANQLATIVIRDLYLQGGNREVANPFDLRWVTVDVLRKTIYNLATRFAQHDSVHGIEG